MLDLGADRSTTPALASPTFCTTCKCFHDLAQVGGLAICKHVLQVGITDSFRLASVAEVNRALLEDQHVLPVALLIPYLLGAVSFAQEDLGTLPREDSWTRRASDLQLRELTANKVCKPTANQHDRCIE